MKHKIFSVYNGPAVVMEANSGESEVDIALYRPTKERIDDYIRSGEQLEDLRRLQYHSDYLSDLELNDENFTDPLMYRGLDRVDLEQMHRDAIADIQARISARSSSAPAEKSEADSSEPGAGRIPGEKSEDVASANNEGAEAKEKA